MTPRVLLLRWPYGERPEQQQTLKVQKINAAREKATANQVAAKMFLPKDREIP